MKTGCIPPPHSLIIVAQRIATCRCRCDLSAPLRLLLGSVMASRRLAKRVDELVALVAARGAREGGSSASVDNIVAFSGGVDSSLAAALVHQAFPRSSAACLGVSAALPRSQLEQARGVASHIGIPLWETPTREAALEGYVANQGRSCYYCKSTLYATINQVAAFAHEEMMRRWAAGSGSARGGSPPESLRPVIYNGTNADDQKDPTRVGAWRDLSHALMDVSLMGMAS
jgi:uncharacterized protein